VGSSTSQAINPKRMMKTCQENSSILFRSGFEVTNPVDCYYQINLHKRLKKESREWTDVSYRKI
jgi:hypothetical protein